MLFALHTRQFIRSKINLWGLLLLFVASITGLYIGKQHRLLLQKEIASVKAYQSAHIQRTVQFENKEMGLLLYYLRFAYINPGSAYSALSIGQQDIHAAVQQVTIRTLEEKKYDADLNNPASLLTGNMDFAFVLTYLFPLLIITFCFNLWSEEKEAGTWPLLRISGNKWYKPILQKAAVRYYAVLGLFLLVCLLAIWIVPLPVNNILIALLCTGWGYISFWFALCGLVVSLDKSSNFNAATLLGNWLLLTILLPALLNSYINQRYPVPEAMETAINNREGYHRKWDEPKAHTMEKFYAHYPQFTRYQLPKKEFSWLWYYAMQQMGDDDAANASNAMRAKLLQRANCSELLGAFLPTVHIQLQLGELAQSGLKNQVYFLDSLTAFHEQKRLYFYPKIFEDAPVLKENWALHQPIYYKETLHINWWKLLLPLAITTMLLTALAIWRVKRYRL